jgi:hypothetical protein
MVNCIYGKHYIHGRNVYFYCYQTLETSTDIDYSPKRSPRAAPGEIFAKPVRFQHESGVLYTVCDRNHVTFSMFKLYNCKITLSVYVFPKGLPPSYILFTDYAQFSQDAIDSTCNSLYWYDPIHILP